MAVIVALKPRAYSEVIGHTLQALRPGLRVEIIEPDRVHQVVERPTAPLVLSSEPEPKTCDDLCTWVEYHPYAEPTALHINGERREMGRSIELSDLLAVVDEFEGAH